MIVTKRSILVIITIIFVFLVVSGDAVGSDWLIKQVEEPAKIEKCLEGKEIILSNGLIRRTLRLQPNAATVAYDNLMTGQSILRGVKSL